MKSIKKLTVYLFITFCGVLAISPVQADGIIGNGKVVEQEREVGVFESIKINGAFTIYLSQDDRYSLKVVTDENLQPVIKNKIKNGCLHITTEKTIYKSEELKLYIGFKYLKSIKANGAIKLRNTNTLRFDDLDIEINGASSADIELTANSLRIDNSGASSIKLKGKTDELFIDISGAGSVNALDLQAKRANVDISGVGNGKIYVIDELKVSISGIGSVKYKGDPKITSSMSFLGTLKKY